MIQKYLLLLATFIVVLGPFSATKAGEIFPRNSDWKFLPGGAEASSPTPAWRALEFDDSAFVDAPSPFWYGDSYPGGTQVEGMRFQYRSFYLRKTFEAANAGQIGALRLGAFVDDGFIAWINGAEVWRENVPPGNPTLQTQASGAANEPPAFVVHELPPPADYLRDGVNVIAVQVFNTSLNSSDIGFDASLESIVRETIPPMIQNVNPAPGTLNSLTSITVEFSETVTGVETDDFRINGNPPGSISGGGSTYTFEFPQPAFGTVFVGWSPTHGIADEAAPPNPFDAAGPGAAWEYELIDDIPPLMSHVFPLPGSVIRHLGQIEVSFNEPVLNVDAADLSINGLPAAELAQASGGPFLFSFEPPPAGEVQVEWAGGHGITDAAAAPNPFDGDSWTYTVDPSAPEADLAINEFLASAVSEAGLVDEDGEAQDWIEIHNRGVAPVDLANWSLSDDPDLPGLWVFPSRTLGPNEYLIVFASGKDRKPADESGELHANFKLSVTGEHLALYTPDSPRSLQCGFESYPEQRNDISYGADASGELRYYAEPTPAGPNGLSDILGVCAPVHVNARRGHFSDPFDLRLSCETPGATLRYTTNGSEPTVDSPVFPDSLRVSDTTLFRAAAFREHYLPSQTVTHSYFFNLPQNIRSLPFVSIVTDEEHLYGPSGILGISGGSYNGGPWSPSGPRDYHNPSQHGLAWERPTSVEWIRPEDNSGFQIDCGVRVHGSDYNRPRITTNSKVSFKLYFRGDYGPGRLEYPLFPLTQVRRFDQLVLRAGFNEQGNPFIRDEIHRRLSSDMGQIAAHGNLAVVFINGEYYAGSPWYNPTERVHEEFLQEHLGGGDEWDVVGPSFAESAGEPGVVDGDRADFQQFVNFVSVAQVTEPSIYQFIERRLDLVNFVDYCLLNAYSAMGDWPPNNWRAGKDRAAEGPWRFVVWDAEWGMGIYNRSININSFTQTGGGPDDSGLGSVGSSEIARMYDRLRGSPEFRLLWADRVQKHFYNGGALTTEHITARFEELREELRALMPNMDTEILDWARNRQPIFFSQMRPQGLLSLVEAPTFSQFGGRVPHGFNLTMTAPDGQIYYTFDGADPRQRFTGDVSSTAELYSGGVSLDSTVNVRARAREGDAWSALTEAAFTVGSLGVPLRITEIMYDPSGGSIHEFLEIENISGAALDLSGFYFDGIDFIFDEGATIAANGRITLASDTDPNSWRARYPGVPVAGWFNGNLNNGGERLSLYDPNDRLIAFVEYKPDGGWPLMADGGGASLEIIDPFENPNDPGNWQASGDANGSPGAANVERPAGSIRMNEVMADNRTAVENAGAFPDWIELHNAGDSAVNLEGWSLTDDDDPRKFVLPDAVIEAGGYLIVWCDDSEEGGDGGLRANFALDRNGETAALYDAGGNRVDAIFFGPQIPDLSLGRINGQWTLNTPTPNAVNSLAALGSAHDLRINEWIANSAPGQSDWIELFNASDERPAALKGIYLAAGGDLHQWLSPAYIAPKGHVVLFADEGAGANHLSFRLPASGGEMALYDETGGEMQRVSYGVQSEGVSEGRFPDGGDAIERFAGSASPGSANYLSDYDGPILNEVLARGESSPGENSFIDFVEIYNDGNVGFDLSGMSLSVNDFDPGEWTFPPDTTLGAGEFAVVYCDSSRPASFTPNEFNVGQSLDGKSGAVYLFASDGRRVDSVEYGFQAENWSIGLSGGQWRLLDAPTPGSANADPAALGAVDELRINEWMAAPSAGADWFELYNPADSPVELSAISLSDDPSTIGRGKFRPAPLSFIGPKGFVDWTADSSPGRGRDHVNFALDARGDSILVYRASGSTFSLLDGVGFGAQMPGEALGSLPDGADEVMFLGLGTRGASNVLIPAETDTDGDGIPDSVEIELGLNFEDFSDGADDADGDGLSNAAEYRAGTDILDASSYLRVEQIALDDGVSLSFQTAADRSYSVLYTDSLDGDDWEKLADIPAQAEGGMESVTDPQALTGVRFYRIVTPMAP